MSTLPERLAELVIRIENGKYPAKQLADFIGLQRQIAKDIGSEEDSTEAMALLGYLLKSEYVRIDAESGIVINKEKQKDIDLLKKALERKG